MQGGESAPARRELLVLLASVTAVLAWFADKAFTVDDPLFLWLGAHIQTDPIDFFGFTVNWNASQLPMHEITQNPPLAGYAIALAAALFGWSEPALHAAFLLPAAVATACTYDLARRFCGRPLEASLIGLLTPVFLVSSTNVMCDTSMLACWVASLACWLRGFDASGGRRLGWWLGAGTLASAAFLTKYFGIALVPLLLAHGLLRERRLGAWCLFLLLPLATAFGYDRLTHALYGTGQLSHAITYAGEFRSSADARTLQQAVVGLCFAGGCLVPALFFAPLLWSRWMLLMGAALFAVAFLAWAPIGHALDVSFLDPFAASVFEEQRTDYGLVAQFLLFALAGLCVVAIAIADTWRRRDPESALLALWALGTFVFAAFVNWVNNGRSILPLAPVLGILIVRRLELREGPPSAAWIAGRRAAFAAGAIVALLVTNADYRWANGVRDMARELASHHVRPERGTLFLGNWGWQYYLEAAGATAVDADHFPQRGDRLLTAHNNADFRVPHKRFVRLLEQKEVYEPRRLRTMMRYLAGFYAHNLGPLPYAWAAPRPDRYFVWEARQRFRFQPRPFFELGDELLEATGGTDPR